MPDLLLPKRLDKVVLIAADGETTAVDWLDPVRGEYAEIRVPRMPATFEEKAWFWRTLPAALAPGASMRYMRPS